MLVTLRQTEQKNNPDELIATTQMDIHGDHYTTSLMSHGQFEFTIQDMAHNYILMERFFGLKCVCGEPPMCLAHNNIIKQMKLKFTLTIFKLFVLFF